VAVTVGGTDVTVDEAVGRGLCVAVWVAVALGGGVADAEALGVALGVAVAGGRTRGQKPPPSM
jgi:hypothetical protein